MYSTVCGEYTELLIKRRCWWVYKIIYKKKLKMLVIL